MQWQHTNNVTCHLTMETRFLLKTCTSPKMQHSEDTDKIFKDKLQRKKIGHVNKNRKKKRERKQRKGTKSYASVILHLFVGKPPVNGF